MKNILLIEDDRDSAELLCMLLEFHGHVVHCAASGREGIDCARAADVDVIVTDLGLPDMHGLELVGQLAQIVDPAHCMIVALTGRSGIEVRDAARQAGVDHFFVKGDDIGPLIALIDSHN